MQITYETAKTLFISAKNKEKGKKIANNTYIIKINDHTYGIKLHDTNVVILYSNGGLILNSSGWKTQTTKDRINYALTPKNLQITSKRGEWYIEDVLFFDKMEIYNTGDIEQNPIQQKMEIAKKKVDKMVSAYIKGFVEDMMINGLEYPSDGDCWYCRLFKSNDVDHLISHMTEKYYVPSLLWNTILEQGYPNPTLIWDIIKNDLDETTPPYKKVVPYHAKRALTKYFRKRKNTLIQEMI